MNRTPAAPFSWRKDLLLLLIAGAMGGAFCLFVSGYWLVDLFPVGNRLIAVALAVLVAASAAYYFLLRWARVPFAALKPASRAAVLVAGVLCGAVLFFGGTAQWLAPSRFVPFLLPVHHLEIEVIGGGSESAISLLWFNTGLGDVSYDSLHYQGWKRAGDQLILQDPARNVLQWTGRTGDAAQIVWHQAGEETVQLSWDGQAETLRPTTGKFTYSRAFGIPWYASRPLVLCLGVLFFASLSIALILLLRERKESLLPGVRQALLPAARPMDRMDVLALAGAATLALVLRLPNLGSLYPAVDEYFQLIAARQIIDGAALASVYQRGLWIVTIPVSLALRVFGYQLWAARLPGILFNVLALLPLYLVARRLNRVVAVLSAVLYAASPWIVTFARIAREYAYYPFYFYWILLGLVVFLESVPQDFVVLRDWRKVVSTRTVLIGIALIVPPLFALYGDRLSTFRSILIAYLVFGVFVLARFDLRDRSNWLMLGLLGVGFLVTALAWYERQRSKIVSMPRFNPVPVSYFVPDPQQQWYYGRIAALILLGLMLAVLVSYLVRRSNIVPLFLLTLVAVYIGFFAFLSKSFFHTRHVLTTQLWYVIASALGLYLIWRVARDLLPWRAAYANVALAALLGLSVFNIPQVLVPITSTNPDNPISEDYDHDMAAVHTYMIAHAQPSDVLISTVYGLYSSWRDSPQFLARYRITTETPRDEIFGLIEQNQSGWIVIDQIRLSMSTLGPREFAGNPDVEYIGLFGDQNVWHWQHAAGNPGN